MTLMAKVIGLGGIFFKSTDPVALATWYKTHLEIPIENWGGAAFYHRDKSTPGYHIWTPFDHNTTYFAPTDKSFMVNFIVDDLAQALLVSKSAILKTLNLAVLAGLSTPMVIKSNYGNQAQLRPPTKWLNRSYFCNNTTRILNGT